MSVGKSDQCDKTLWLSKHAWNWLVPLVEDYLHCIYECHIFHWAVDSGAILGRHSISVSWVSAFMCQRYLLLFKILPFGFVWMMPTLYFYFWWWTPTWPKSLGLQWKAHFCVPVLCVFGHSLVSRGKVPEKVARPAPLLVALDPRIWKFLPKMHHLIRMTNHRMRSCHCEVTWPQGSRKGLEATCRSTTTQLTQGRPKKNQCHQDL